LAYSFQKTIEDTRRKIEAAVVIIIPAIKKYFLFLKNLILMRSTPMINKTYR